MKKINISIDDVSPHPNSSIRVLDRCFELIAVFPDIKFSLFIPMSYWRTRSMVTKNPLQIDLFPDFCKYLKDLPVSNFEICYHGFYHGIPGKSDNDEFQYFEEKEADERFKAMFEVSKKSGLEDVFKPIFRPPAWRMSPGAIRAARKAGIEVLALSPKDYAKNVYDGEENKKNDVVYYNCNSPFDDLELYEATEIVYHACEWDKNYLSTDMLKELKEFLKLHEAEIKFCFIKELVNEKQENTENTDA